MKWFSWTGCLLGLLVAAACNNGQATSSVPLEIRSVTPGLVDHKYETELIVRGANFQTGLQFYFNDNTVNYRWISSEQIRAWVPGNVDLCGPMKIGIRNPSVGDQPGEYVETSSLFSYFSKSAAFSKSALAVSGVATSPVSVATADFNGDGRVDLLFAEGNRNLSLALRNEDGTLAAAQVLTLRDFPTTGDLKQLVAGDVDADGKVDLVARLDDKGLFWAKGNGDGTFAAGQSVTASVTTAMGNLVLLDTNGDGQLDVVAFDTSDAKKIQVFSLDVNTAKQLGSATELLASTMDFTSRPEQALVGMDVDADGRMDVVAFFAEGTGTSVLPLQSKGNGSFSAARSQKASLPYAVAAASSGDVNFDGVQDLVVLDFVPKNDVQTIHVLIGVGDGGFTKQARSFWLDSSGTLLSVGDWNGDRRLDVMVPLSSSKLQLFQNQCSAD